jgi:hypothetical protein
MSRITVATVGYEEQLAAGFGGGDRGGGRELGDLADGGGAQFLVADGAAHAGVRACCWHQAYRAS